MSKSYKKQQIIEQRQKEFEEELKNSKLVEFLKYHNEQSTENDQENS